jgi:hypothetical protein
MDHLAPATLTAAVAGMAAAVWINWQLDVADTRSLLAYDH